MIETQELTTFPHWMLREIYEQPETVKATLETYVSNGRFRGEICGPIRQWLREAGDKIVIAASGSSRHAALVAEVLIEDASGIAVDVEYASEYTYRSPGVLSGKTAKMKPGSAGGFAVWRDGGYAGGAAEGQECRAENACYYQCCGFDDGAGSGCLVSDDSGS